MPEHAVALTIHSTQTQGGEGQQVEQAAQGTLRRSGDKLLLRYEEEGGATRTALRLEEGRVTILRSGELGCDLVLSPGLRHDSTYRTPYGSFPISVTAGRVDWRAGEDGGEVELVYDLILAGQSAGTTHFRLRWTNLVQEEME